MRTPKQIAAPRANRALKSHLRLQSSQTQPQPEPEPNNSLIPPPRLARLHHSPQDSYAFA